MPKSIVSDRDPRITARFWRELSRVLGSEVNLSTAQHPQSDGQSEREIQTLTTALRSCGLSNRVMLLLYQIYRLLQFVLMFRVSPIGAMLCPTACNFLCV